MAHAADETRANPTWAVVLGRMGSSRMPGKTMAPLAGRPALAHVVDRLRLVSRLDGIVVATTGLTEDDVISDCAGDAAVPVYRGSADDVLARTLEAAQWVGAATIVRITADCPVIDPTVVETVITEFQRERPDFASNCLDGYSYPIGIAVEVFPVALLAAAARETTDPLDREHVTLFFEKHPERFDLLGVAPPGQQRRPDLRVTLDTQEDYKVISAVYDALYGRDPQFGLDAVIAFLDQHPEIVALNRHVRQVTV
jgi:spore coat polysaccharide biosynthesis protein SpsF